MIKKYLSISTYIKKDIDYIRFQATNNSSKIITTEKDYMKIKSFKNDDIKYLKIAIQKNDTKI